ncbi:MAG: hypothetical protein ACLR9T_08040 [Thomasclavelia sp.]|uniref:hypothetical protein n=1 Tax=Thomasclavelia sp. TaxID=3025757 RepID=UPI0039A042AF
MKKQIIRFIVGFPLGVFMANTLLIIYRLLTQSKLEYFNSFAFTIDVNTNILIQYILCGIIGMLSISFCTLLEDLSKPMVNQIILHTCFTFITELVFCIIGNIIENKTFLIILLAVYIMLLIIGYYVLYRKTNKYVENLNQYL